jgi:alpha-galactosidase
MSEFEVLEVRFHFNGEFVLDASKILYCDGDYGVSHIEKDKISIPELEGHLLDHTTFPRSSRMYWLPYGADLNTRMRLLVDDKSCLDMINELGTGGAVDIYTEPIRVGCNEESETQYADEDVFALFRDDNIMDLDHTEPVVNEENIQDANMLHLEGPTQCQDGLNDDEEESESESGCHATGFTTDEDDKFREMRTKYQNFMLKAKKRGDIPLDNTIEVDGIHCADPNSTDQALEGGDGVPYFDSDGDASYDEDSDGVVTRRKCRFPIFNSSAETSQFCVDMCFKGRDELKDAIERYALKMKTNIKYVKNDLKRIRVVCRWKGCPWLLYASHNSRSDWF